MKCIVIVLIMNIILIGTHETSYMSNVSVKPAQTGIRDSVYLCK